MDWQDATAAVMAAGASWLIVLIGGGLVAAGINQPSPFSVLGIGLGIVLLNPVRYLYRVVDHERGARAGIDAYLFRHRFRILITILLGLISTAALMAGTSSIVFDVLTLPFRGVTPILYRARLFYGQLLGAELASILFVTGVFYIQLVWLHLLSAGLLAITHKTGLTNKRY